MELPAGLIKRGNTFYIKYKHRGKWVRKSVGQDLDAALEEHARIRGPATEPKKTTVPLLSECVRDWLENQRARNKPSTIENAISRSSHLLRVIGDLRADLLTSADIDRYRRHRKKAGIKPATINCDFRILKGILRFAVAERKLQEMPCRIQFERAPKRKSLNPFTPDQVALILAKAEPRVRVLLLFAAEAGLRLDEILHLQWRDIDFADRRVHVREKIYWRRNRKGERVEEHWSPKSHQARVVYVGAGTIADLEAFRATRRWASDEDWILQSSAPPKARWAHPKKKLREAFVAAGLYVPGNMAHAFRHSFATAALTGGVDLETLRDVLGHADLATTAGYLHAVDERKRRTPELAGLVRRSE